MAAPVPGDLIPNFALLANGASAPAQGIFIPLASLSGLSAAEANETTGDGRKVLFEIAKAAQTAFAAITPAPSGLAVTRSTPTGVNATTIRQSYTMQFDLTIADVDVAPSA
jgi:hypothetical protein